MAGVEMITVATEMFGKTLHQGGADTGHADWSAPLGCQATHLDSVEGTIIDQAKQPHRGADVQVCSVIGDPMSYGDAQSGQLASASPNTAQKSVILAVVGRKRVLGGRTGDVQIAKRRDQCGLEAGEVLANGKAMPTEGDDGIDGQLTGTVNQTAAAAVDPADRDLPVLDKVALHGHIGGRTRSAYGDNGRMLAQQQDDLTVTAVAALVDQTLLEGQGGVEIDLAEQKRFEGGRGRF